MVPYRGGNAILPTDTDSHIKMTGQPSEYSMSFGSATPECGRSRVLITLQISADYNDAKDNGGIGILLLINKIQVDYGYAMS